MHVPSTTCISVELRSISAPEATAPTSLAVPMILIRNLLSIDGSPFAILKTSGSSTKMVAPTIEVRTTVLRQKRSHSIPFKTVANPAAFRSATRNASIDSAGLVSLQMSEVFQLIPRSQK
ncbi:unnamed protein product [Diplocarpon coronariae]